LNPPTIRDFADTTTDPPVRGFLHTPATPNGSGLVLTHGAGGNAQAPLLRALADAFAEAGYAVLRCNLPYRQSRSFGPPGPSDAARDRAGLKNAINALQKTFHENTGGQNAMGAPFLAGVARSGDFDSHAKSDSSNTPSSEVRGRIYLGGHSYGGRQSSMLCAELSKEDPNLVAGLLLLSYPLHPPRRPEQQRTQHLPDLHTPALFVSGTRDPFGTIDELQRALKMIPAKTKLLTVEGAGHDLGFKGKGKKEELPEKILSVFTELLELSY
jgi:predicted alpha/beta-hydrolase family hydrolase